MKRLAAKSSPKPQPAKARGGRGLISNLVRKRARKVMVPKTATIEDMEIHTRESERAPTVIPRITDPNVEEIEIKAIREPYKGVLATYNFAAPDMTGIELSSYVY